MTHEETGKLIGAAMLAYPRWLENAGKEQLMAMTATWHRLLGDLDYRLADTAMAKHIATSAFPPTIAEIRAACASLLPSGLPDAETAWAEVLREMKNTGYARTPAWSHPILPKVVDAMWGSWPNACASVMQETIGVDRGQFIRMYGTLTKREHEALLLPASVTQTAGLLAARLAVPGAR